VGGRGKGNGGEKGEGGVRRREQAEGGGKMGGMRLEGKQGRGGERRKGLKG